MPSTAKLLAASTMLAVGTAASAATVNIDNFKLFNTNTDDTLGNNDDPIISDFSADGSDMLVVLITGEHGFNNTAGDATSVTYNGQALTEIVERNPIASQTDTLYGDIWILENPTGNGKLEALAATRGNIAAFALSSSDPVNKPGLAVRNSVVGATGSNSVTFDTLEDSLVLAALNLGGGGNTAGLGGTGVGPGLTFVGSQEEGNNWDGHVVGQTTVTTSGSNTYSFVGGNLSGAFTYAIEIQAVPEPTSMLVGAIGLGGLLVRRRRNG